LITGFALGANGAYAGPNAPTMPKISPVSMSSMRSAFPMRAPAASISTSAVRPHLSLRAANTVNRDFNDLTMRFVASVSSLERQTQVDDLLGQPGAGSLGKAQVRRAGRDLAAASSEPAGNTAKTKKSHD
jgi:hypothetical protein